MNMFYSYNISLINAYLWHNVGLIDVFYGIISSNRIKDGSS